MKIFQLEIFHGVSEEIDSLVDSKSGSLEQYTLYYLDCEGQGSIQVLIILLHWRTAFKRNEMVRLFKRWSTAAIGNR